MASIDPRTFLQFHYLYYHNVNPLILRPKTSCVIDSYLTVSFNTVIVVQSVYNEFVKNLHPQYNLLKSNGFITRDGLLKIELFNDSLYPIIVENGQCVSVAYVFDNTQNSNKKRRRTI